MTSPADGPSETGVKTALARTIKWNLIDKVSSQVLYAVTGVVLARMLSQEDFGLVGAIAVFQAFAQLFVDSGFSSALIQRKKPTQTDYSTVFWFNMAMSVALYGVLWLLAPAIASLFQDDTRLIGLSRVMFLTFILNAASIVQANRLIKHMTVKWVTLSNSAGLIGGAVVGIWLAVSGYGAWAIVWQTITVAVTKGAILWWRSGWCPSLTFSFVSLKSCFSVGAGVMGQSFLNTVFQNIYSFLIGNRVGLASLGYFTQADKWSKMGVMSLSQTLTSSFLPVLSRYQDDPGQFASAAARMNRLTAYLLFPAMGFLAVMATPIFHALFGTKWDPAIMLFQILLLRGVFTVLTALYNNYILALGRARLLVATELLRDAVALAAIVVTLPYLALATPSDPVAGPRILLWGQVIATVITWIATLVITVRLIPAATAGRFLLDLAPYLAMVIPVAGAMWWLSTLIANVWGLLAAQAIAGCALWLGLGALLGSRIQREAIGYIIGRR